MENTTENNSAEALDRSGYSVLQCTCMAKTPKKPEKVQLRTTDQDYAIILAGMKKHGLDVSQILRMALRRFAEAEGIRVN